MKKCEILIYTLTYHNYQFGYNSSSFVKFWKKLSVYFFYNSYITISVGRYTASTQNIQDLDVCLKSVLSWVSPMFFRTIFVHRVNNIKIEQTITSFVFFPIEDMLNPLPPPQFFSHFYVDTQRAESNEKSIFGFFRSIYFELCLIVFIMYGWHTGICKCVTNFILLWYFFF